MAPESFETLVQYTKNPQVNKSEFWVVFLKKGGDHDLKKWAGDDFYRVAMCNKTP